jgi:hypothetical protein
MALAASAVIGLLSIGVLATPASAHDAKIRGTAVCETKTGQYIVSWKVFNDFPEDMRLEGVSGSPTRVSMPGVVPASHGRDDTFVTGTQRVPGNAVGAAVRIERVRWDDGYEQDNVVGGVRLAGTCKSAQRPPQNPPPGSKPCVTPAKAKYTHVLDGAKGTAKVTMTGAKPLCKGAKQPFALISYTAPATPGVPEVKFDSATGTIDSKSSTTTLTVNLPPCATKVYLVWDATVIEKLTPTSVYGGRVLGSPGAPGNQSKGAPGVYTGGNGECGDKPSVTFEDSCKGVDITLVNGGSTPAEFFGEAKVGEGDYQPFDKPVTVAPGKSETMFIKGAKGLTVRVTSGATINSEHRWVPPASCTVPGTGPKPPAEGGASGGLPVTGVSITIMVISALLATGLGVGLVMLARRRREAAGLQGDDDATTIMPSGQA